MTAPGAEDGDPAANGDHARDSDPAAGDPAGDRDPGAVKPGAVDPRAVKPGAVDPGAVKPAAVDPGAVDAGGVVPGDGGDRDSTGSERRERIGLLFQIFRTHLVSSKLVGRALEPTGLGGEDYAVYSYLLFGPMTLTALADGTGMPLTTAADYVKRFDQRGHIVRQPNPDDGRSRLLSLTPAARDLVLDTAEVFSKTVGHLDAVMEEAGIDSARLVDQLLLVQDLLARALDDLDRPSRG
ncbi:MAG TPA: MarR family winged helix-turn-helix transcriptional regulator [Nitriliruptoraceae bacterium]|nr:MarR family winged helix-turn-helix transcriptional regulator [Nitriliruptoraceae bacterium]